VRRCTGLSDPELTPGATIAVAMSAQKGVPVYKEQVEYLVKLLVEHPDQVVVETIDEPHALSLKLHVAPGDLGRVIGKQGRTARAIRTLLHAAAARARRRVVLVIVE
jgi:uncharacterized protein